MASNLWAAILLGQYDLAYQMISRGANVNVRIKIANHDPMMTLLHYAVRLSDVRCIRVLASLSANFNARDSQNLTPLHWAIKYNASPDVVEVLINKGAAVDARDDDKFTTLHHCAISKNNCIELAEKLIAGGASINAIVPGGRSVLHMAVSYHNLEMVKMLISHGVNIDAKDKCGNTPLLRYFSEQRKGEDKTEIIQLLLDNGADVNSKSHNTLFSLFYAAKFNHLASLHLLLKWGARVNEAIDIGYTALHAACENQLADMTALLLEFGANLNACTWEDKTPFELLPNSPSSEATAQIIISEAVKCEALGQSLCEGYKRMVQSHEKYSKFERKCREEIKRMQIDIEDSAISFFHILSMDEEKLTALARNEKFVTAFESSKASFRIYATGLTKKFQSAKKRANFISSVEDCLDDVVGGVFPAAVVQKIAAYVKYDDIFAKGLYNDCD